MCLPVYGNGIHAELAETDVDFEDATIGTAPADYDGDGEITFNEIKRFTQNHCVANHMRMYPSDNQEVFLPAAQKAEKASFEKAILHYAIAITSFFEMNETSDILSGKRNAECRGCLVLCRVCMGPAAAFVYRLRSGRTS